MKHFTRKTYIRFIRMLIICIMSACMFIPGTSDAAQKEYIVNGTVLPLSEKGYVPGQYRGAGMCWEFARHIYYSIWDRLFYQNPGSEDDMLREYPGGEERRISAETARIFITAAEIGAVI